MSETYKSWISEYDWIETEHWNSATLKWKANPKVWRTNFKEIIGKYKWN